MTKKNIVIGDADSLIALFLEYDTNHKKATAILKRLHKTGTLLIYPNTAIAEAITALMRKYTNPQLASYITQQYKDNRFIVEYIDEKIMKNATKIFNPTGSKQNTFFDALVAATATQLSTDTIFSFDAWYTKKGFKLAGDRA